MKKLKNLVLSLALTLGLMAPLALTTGAYALTQNDINQSVCQGTDLQTGSGCNPSDSSASKNVNDLIKNIINIFSFIVGTVSVIMIIYGGFRYITSGGDSNSVTAAKNTILYAIIGLVIVAFAQIIVKFVLEKSTSST